MAEFSDPYGRKDNSEAMKTRPNAWHKSFAIFVSACQKEVTYGQTNRQTDGQTDGRTDR